MATGGHDIRYGLSELVQRWMNFNNLFRDYVNAEQRKAKALEDIAYEMSEYNRINTTTNKHLT